MFSNSLSARFTVPKRTEATRVAPVNSGIHTVRATPLIRDTKGLTLCNTFIRQCSSQLNRGDHYFHVINYNGTPGNQILSGHLSGSSSSDIQKLFHGN